MPIPILPLLGALGLFQGANLIPIAAAVPVGRPAPHFKLEGTDGKTYELAQFRGRQAVLLVWNPVGPGSG